MKRFFASLLLCTMLMALMPFAMAENAEKTAEEVISVEEIAQTESADCVQFAASKAENKDTSIAFADLRKTLFQYNYSVKALNVASDAAEEAVKDAINESIKELSINQKTYQTLAASAQGIADASTDAALKTEFLGLAQYWNGLNTATAAQINYLSGASSISNNVTVETTQNSCNDAVNQIVKGAEALYIGILTMQNAVGDVQRGIDTLERMVKLTEKQKEIGMASDYDVEGMKYQYESAKSQLDSLKYQIKTSKMTLEGMLGMELNGTVTLGSLTMPTDKEISEIDYEKKLSAAKGRNVDVMNAEAKYYGDSADGSYESVKAAEDSFAYQFKIVCLNVPEKQRLMKVAEDAVTYQQRTFEIAAKKYEMGMLSREEYLNAEGELESAKSSLNSAKLDLFSAYRAYVWASQYGIV